MWEYLIIIQDGSINIPGSHLNKCGLAGWELTGICPFNGSMGRPTYFQLIFKRPISREI